MPVNPETQRPTRATQKTAKRKVKRTTATRTPTELGQTTPSRPKGQKAKAAAIQAASAPKKKVRKKVKAQREYERALDQAAKKAHRAEVHARHEAKKVDLAESGVSRTNFGQAVRERRLDRQRPDISPDSDLVKDVRTKIKWPTAEELAVDVATTVGPAAAFKAVRAGQAILRGEKVLGTAERAAKATKVAEEAKTARKAERAAARAKESTKTAKARATAKGMSAQARKRLAKTEVKAAAKRQAAKAADRTVNSSVPGALAAGSVAPGDVGDRTRAFVIGSAKADPIKAAHATLEAVPALFTAGASLGGAAYRTAKTGDPGYLEGAAKAIGKGAVDVVKPYVSGDPEKVKKATENTGYILAPLAPRGAVSRPARAVGRGVKKTAEHAAEPVAKRVRVRRAKSGRVGPSKTQKAVQAVTGGKKRKDVAVTFARQKPEVHRGMKEAFDIEQAVNKAKGSHGLRNRYGPDAGAAAGVVARYGVDRKNTIRHLQAAAKTVEAPHNDMVNLTNTVEWLRRNPDVVKDERFWGAVEQIRKTMPDLEFSQVAKYGPQADVAGIPLPPKDATKAEVRAFVEKVRGALLIGSRDRAAFERLSPDDRVWVFHGRTADGRSITTGTGGAMGHATYVTLDPKLAKSFSGEHGRVIAYPVRKRDLAQSPDARTALGRPVTNDPADGLFMVGEAIIHRDKLPDAEIVIDPNRPVAPQLPGRHPELVEPVWLSEKRTNVNPEVPGGNKVGLKQYQQRGINRQYDVVDRSLPSVLRNSVINPRVVRATSRAVRITLARHRIKVGGKTVFKGRQLLKLAEEGKVDLTRYTPVPSRWWKAPLENDVWDPVGFHQDTIKELSADRAALAESAAKGTDYVLVPNEVARELVDQLAPQASREQKVIGGVAGIASRTVLYSPAWVAAQFVNETSQVLADAGARGTLGAAADMVKMRFKDPEGYHAALRVSGDPYPVAKPVAPRLPSASDYLDYGNAARIARKTPVGRFLHDAVRLRTFANIDRWKTTRLRTVALLAKNNKDFGRFTVALGRTVDGMEDISKKLSKMSRAERHKYIINDPEGLLRRQLDHVDDMLGNWDAFTRFERSFGPLLAFYPYLRMSLRWTFLTYPKKHPIKAGILYVLAQQNHEQLEKLLGGSPDFIQSAYPALYNKEGQPDAVMPGGARFGAPGSNVLVEAIGSGNVAGVARLLNPALSTGAFAFFGVNPFTGKQEAVPGTTEWGLNAATALLSTFPPARVSKAQDIRGESDAAKVFAQLDPHRALRSILNPFIPLSAERYRMQQTLSNALEAASNKPEYGDLIDAILAHDRKQVRALAKRVDLAAEAQDVIDQFMPPSKAENKALDKAGEVSREGTKALKKSKPSQTTGSGGGGWFDTSQKSSSGGGWFD